MTFEIAILRLFYSTLQVSLETDFIHAEGSWISLLGAIHQALDQDINLLFDQASPMSALLQVGTSLAMHTLL